MSKYHYTAKDLTPDMLYEIEYWRDQAYAEDPAEHKDRISKRWDELAEVAMDIVCQLYPIDPTTQWACATHRAIVSPRSEHNNCRMYLEGAKGTCVLVEWTAPSLYEIVDDSEES